VQDRSLEITFASNAILFKKEVREAPIELNADILVTHRYDVSGHESTSEQAIPDEFLINKAYRCEVILTNVSPKEHTFSVLF
jgi:hypothetical protein